VCSTEKIARVPPARSHSPSLSIQPGSTSRSDGVGDGCTVMLVTFCLMGCTDAVACCVVGNSCSTAVCRVVVIHGEEENRVLSSGRKLLSFRFQRPWFSGITGSNPERVKQGLSSSETNGVSCSKLPMILFVRCCVTLKTAS